MARPARTPKPVTLVRTSQERQVLKIEPIRGYTSARILDGLTKGTYVVQQNEIIIPPASLAYGWTVVARIISSQKEEGASPVWVLQ